MTAANDRTADSETTLAVLLPCQGQCPGSRQAGVITCEGACSGLTTRWLARRLTLEREERGPWAWPTGRTALVALLAAAMLLGCTRQAPAAPSRTTGSYALSVLDPPPVKVGAPAVATVQVLPRGSYKINVEFPLKLKVSGPAAASPRELLLTMKQAARLTKGELLLKPRFTLTAPGRHQFKGTLRFSVCTDAQCEIKTEEVVWTAVGR